MEIEGYLTVKEAAEILNITGGRIRQFIADGRLNSIKVGTTRIIKKDDLESLAVNRTGRPSAENPSKATLAKRRQREQEKTNKASKAK